LSCIEQYDWIVLELLLLEFILITSVFSDEASMF
jgi:hypothetical protein